jgi:hypothetical protein
MPVRAPRPSSAWRWAAIALIAASMSKPARADGPRGAEWASKDAVLYLEATRPKDVLDRLADPKMQGRLAAIPAYEKALKSPKFQELKNGVQYVSTLLDTTWDEGLGKLAGGGLVFVAEATPGEPAWGFLAVTPTDPGFLKRAHAKVLELARDDAKSKGKPEPFREEAHRGVAIFGNGKDEAHAIVKDTLVISKTPEMVRRVIDRALDGPGESIASDPEWKARRAKVGPETLAWGLARLDRLREVNKGLAIPPTTNPVGMLAFGPWIEAFRKAPWAAAEVRWGGPDLGAEVVLPKPPGGYSDAMKRFFPAPGVSAGEPLAPRGTIASLSIWRDLASLWEVRADLFPPEVVQGLAQLDTVAGQFFGGRDFGSGVLGAIGPDVRLVVAEQDYASLKPVPDTKLPAFALVIDLKPDDEEFAQRLKAAFVSFVGLANLGAAQSKAPPLELTSEAVDGVMIQTSRFMPIKPAPGSKGKEPVHQRHNFSPSAMQVGDHFVIASSLGLARDLVPALRHPAKATGATAILRADGPTLAHLLDLNRQKLVTRNMMEKGNDKAAAGGEVDLLLGLLRYAGKGTLTADDSGKDVVFRLGLKLGAE